PVGVGGGGRPPSRGRRRGAEPVPRTGGSLQPDSPSARTLENRSARAAGDVALTGTACRFRWGIFMVVITNPTSGRCQCLFYVTSLGGPHGRKRVAIACELRQSARRTLCGLRPDSQRAANFRQPDAFRVARIGA